MSESVTIAAEDEKKEETEATTAVLAQEDEATKSPFPGAIVLQTKIQETKSSKRTSVYYLFKLPDGERATDTIQLAIVTTWHRNDRPVDEKEKPEIFEMDAFSLTSYLMTKGKRLPR